MVDERHEGPLGRNEGGFPTGEERGGWQQPGASDPSSTPPGGGFGQPMPPPSGPQVQGSSAPGATATFGGPGAPPPPGAPPSLGTPPPPSGGFVVTGGPKRSRSPWVVVGVLVALFVLVIGGCAAMLAVGRSADPFEDTGYPSNDIYGDDYFIGDQSPPTVAPPVAIPPADAAAATTEIVALYDKVFSPETSIEVWPTLFTDPDGLEPLGLRLRDSACAAGAVPVVTAVQFTSDDAATVTFRFEGENVPDLGRSYNFVGGAQREPGAAWKATRDGLTEVVAAADGYC